MVCLAPEPGLFETPECASTPDQLRFAAAHGFRGFVDAGWMTRSRQEQDELLTVAAEVGLRWGPIRGPSCPQTLTTDEVRDWSERFDVACCAAKAMGAPGVRIEVLADRIASDRTDRIGDLFATARQHAADRSLTVFVEPFLLPTCAAPRHHEAFVDCLTQETPPHLRLSVDVYRLASMFGESFAVDVPRFLDRYLPVIGHLELADFPGGLEPGTGELDVPLIFSLLDKHRYSGMVGLRHGRSLPGRAGVAAVLRACARITEGA
jgi:hydroxypyruvate isomerase